MPKNSFELIEELVLMGIVEAVENKNTGELKYRLKSEYREMFQQYHAEYKSLSTKQLLERLQVEKEKVDKK